MRSAMALSIAVATAGCASNPGSWNPAAIAQESHIYAGGGLATSHAGDDKAAIDANVIASVADFGLTVSGNRSTLDKSDLAFTAALGYRIAPFFGVEAAYYRLGKEKYSAVTTADDGTGPSPFNTDFEARTTGLGISGLAFLPLKENYELYARGGLLLANTDFDVTQSFQGQSQSGTSSSNSTDFFVGAGFSYYYQDQLDFRVEYQRFLSVGNSDTGETDIDVIGLQVMYSIF